MPRSSVGLRRWRPGANLAVLLPFRVVRRAGAGRPEEQLAAVRIRDVAPVCAVAAVLGLIAGHDDRRADFERVARDAATHQGVRSATLDHPLFGGAVAFLYVDVNPRVRVDPLRFAD